MDKKQFLESFVSLLPDNSGHRMDSLAKIQYVLSGLKSSLSSTSLLGEFEKIEKEILCHAWMFEQVCNGKLSDSEEDTIAGPLIVIAIEHEILFVNRAYCKFSGLSPGEIQLRVKDGTLYDTIYSPSDAIQARQGISRLHIGKGYKQLELCMLHSRRRFTWNSYGGLAGSLEIRSGKEIYNENDQKKERDRFYRGSIMSTTQLIEKLYQVIIHGPLSAEGEQKLVWIQEFLSMFDFLWNHSDFFMEIIDLPADKESRIYGFYNTIYAQFFGTSYKEKLKLKDIVSVAHGGNIMQFLGMRRFNTTPSTGEFTFHKYNKTPVARVYWQYCIYPHELSPGYNRLFSIGVLVHKIQTKNIFSRILHALFKK